MKWTEGGRERGRDEVSIKLMCVCMCVCLCVRMYARVYVCVVCACVSMCASLYVKHMSIINLDRVTLPCTPSLSLYATTSKLEPAIVLVMVIFILAYTCIAHCPSMYGW